MTELSIVFSFRNEEAVIEMAVERIDRILTEARIDYELVFVDDASTDRSAEILSQMADSNARIKVVTMSRCFGLWECVIAGLEHASGAWVAYMDIDLQDPPEMIPGMMEKARAESADVVHTVRTARHGESKANLFVKKIGYHLLYGLAEVPMPVEAGDFKLLSRRVVDNVVRIKDVDPFMRGIVPWVGFKQVSVEYERQPRIAGHGHFSFLNKRTLGHFINAVTGYSIAPLFLVFGVGVIASLLAVAVLLFSVLAWAVGFVSAGAVGSAFWFMLWSATMACLGVISVYVARISREVQRRPRYIVATTHNIDKNRK